MVTPLAGGFAIPLPRFECGGVAIFPELSGVADAGTPSGGNPCVGADSGVCGIKALVRCDTASGLNVDFLT